MQEIRISTEICNKKISWLKVDKKIKKYLKDNGMETIRDVLHNQDSIPNEYYEPIKTQILFTIMGIK